VLFCYPLAPNLWAFLALMFLANFIGTFGTPFEALKLEIIPPDMRGRSAAMNTWVCTVILGSLGTLLYINQWGCSFQEMAVTRANGRETLAIM